MQKKTEKKMLEWIVMTPRFLRLGLSQITRWRRLIGAPVTLRSEAQVTWSKDVQWHVAFWLSPSVFRAVWLMTSNCAAVSLSQVITHDVTAPRKFTGQTLTSQEIWETDTRRVRHTDTKRWTGGQPEVIRHRRWTRLKPGGRNVQPDPSTSAAKIDLVFLWLKLCFLSPSFHFRFGTFNFSLI